MRGILVLAVLGALVWLSYDFFGTDARGATDARGVKADPGARTESGAGNASGESGTAASDSGTSSQLASQSDGTGPRVAPTGDAGAPSGKSAAGKARLGPTETPPGESGIERFRSLVAAGELREAVRGLGGRNQFLSDPGVEKALKDFLVKAQKLSAEERLLALSGLLDAMTSGQAVLGRFDAWIEEVYGRQQSALGETLFRRSGTWHSRHVRLKHGMTLDGIANQFEKDSSLPMSAGLLCMVNGIRNPKGIRAGDKIRIPTDRLHVRVEKGAHMMKVFLGEALVRLYPVGLGAQDQDSDTPVAEFTVIEKTKDPAWTNPRTGRHYPPHHPENALGGFFVKLQHETLHRYGIHGTNDSESIGKNRSMGCVRLREADIREFFAYIPRRTKVVIRP